MLKLKRYNMDLSFLKNGSAAASILTPNQFGLNQGATHDFNAGNGVHLNTGNPPGLPNIPGTPAPTTNLPSDPNPPTPTAPSSSSPGFFQGIKNFGNNVGGYAAYKGLYGGALPTQINPGNIGGTSLFGGSAGAIY